MQVQTIHWQGANRKAGHAIVYRREVIHSANPFLIGQQLALPARLGSPLVFVGGGVAGSVTALERHRVSVAWPDWWQEIERMASHYRVRSAGGEAPWIACWLDGMSPLDAWARRCFKAAA